MRDLEIQKVLKPEKYDNQNFSSNVQETEYNCVSRLVKSLLTYLNFLIVLCNSVRLTNSI